MPQYELMYLLNSDVADTEVSDITSEVKKHIESLEGTSVVENLLGKKKLAYPIKKTRNGHYVVVNFEMDANKINIFSAKIKSMNLSIIRYLLINLEEHLGRTKKDKVEQEKLSKAQTAKPAKPKEAPKITTKKPSTPDTPPIEINQEELDKKIEEALSEDLTK